MTVFKTIYTRGLEYRVVSKSVQRLTIIVSFFKFFGQNFAVPYQD